MEINFTRLFIFILISVGSAILLVVLAVVMFLLGESITFILLTLYSGVQLALGMGFITSFIAAIYARFALFNDCIR